MANGEDIIPFAKEMLRQRPSQGMLKIYILGSTLAMLGMVGGLVEKVFLPFLEDQSVEDEGVEELFFEKNRREKQWLISHATFVHTEAEDMLGTVLSEAKAKHLGTVVRRDSVNRIHAC